MDLGGPKEPCVEFYQGKGSFGGISQPVVKYREYPVCDCDQCAQPYYLGGSSNVAFCCHHCSNLYLD